MEQKSKFYVVAALLSGISYIIWLYFVINSIIADLFFLQEATIFFMFVIYVMNHSKKSDRLHGGTYSLRAIVDIFITTKNEPVALLERTIKSASEITNPNKRIYVIDDSARKEVKQLCELYPVTYLVRADRETKTDKSASLNYAFSKSFGNFILTLDADQWVTQNILDDLLGHFKKENVAIVTTRQAFDVPEDNFNHDHLFYGHRQPGINTKESEVSCGSGVIYRRSALQSINGFQEWNILEHLYTSYVLNDRGYKNISVSQAYTKSEAPRDLKTIYKLREILAVDTLRMFFWKQPFWNLNLSFMQRLLYFETGYIYVINAIIIPSLYLTNFYSLYSNTQILSVGMLYFIFRLPSFLFIMKVYNDLGKESSNVRMWAGLFPVFLVSTIKALLYFKPKYMVARKEANPQRNIFLILPQFITILIGIIGLLYSIVSYGLTSFLAVNIFWICAMCYWLWPVFPKAFFVNNKAKSHDKLNFRLTS